MSDELRNLMRESAEKLSVPRDDIGEVLRSGRSLKWRKRLYAASVVVLVATLSWAGIPALTSSPDDDDDAPRIATSPTATITDRRSPTPTPPSGPCKTVPFRPMYLPEGWSYELQGGSGGQVGVSTKRQPPGALGHYRPHKGATAGRYVDVMIQGTSYTLAPDDGEPIEVLGEEGRIGNVHDGFAVEFAYGDCEYSVMAFGISKGQLRQIAERLRPTDTCTGQPVSTRRLDIPDGKHFGYILAIDGESAIEFDPAEMLTGDEANDAAEAAGAIEEGEGVPNDYFIRNEDKSSGSLRLSQDPKVLIETVSMDGSVGPAPADTPWLFCAFGSDDPMESAHARSPYWVTVKNGEATRIEEQYLP